MPRRPDPLKQHVARGTYRKDRHGKIAGAFDPLTEAPPCPDSIISKKAKAAWNTIMPILTSSGRLAPEDLPGLELAFRDLGVAIALQDEIEQLDAVQEASTLRALSAVCNQRQASYLAIMKDFGLSPRGREAILLTMQKDAAEKRPTIMDEIRAEMEAEERAEAENEKLSASELMTR